MKKLPPELPPKLKPALTDEQIKRREEINQRNELIGKGIKAKDGVTFGKKA